MKNLFQITEEVRQLASLLEEGEFTPELESQLQIVESEFQEKAINYGYAIKSIKADMAAIKTEIERLEDLQYSKMFAIERMQDSLKAAMLAFNVDKVEIPTMKISFTKSKSVFIEDETLIPANYKTTPKAPEPRPDKIKIKKAIESGELVLGASIQENKNLKIK